MSKKIQHQKQPKTPIIAQKHNCVIDSPVGRLGITVISNQLNKIDYLPATSRLVSPKNPAACKVVVQLKKYFIKNCIIILHYNMGTILF